jgi:hypothetical protein
MKRLLLFVFVLGLALFCRAQSAGAGQNKIQISVSNTLLILVAQNKSVTLGSLSALDSCLRKIIPGLGRPIIEVGSEDGTDRERMRQVAVILESYHCPVISGARRSAGPPAPLRRIVDTSGH